jgi:chromosome segregation ATPase
MKKEEDYRKNIEANITVTRERDMYKKESDKLKRMLDDAKEHIGKVVGVKIELKSQHKEVMNAAVKKHTEETEALKKNLSLSASIEAERDNMDEQLTELQEKHKQLLRKMNNSTEEQLKADQEELRLLHIKCSELEQDVKAKESQLTIQNKDIQSKEEAIVKLEQNLSLKDSKIESQYKSIEAKVETIQALENKLKAKNDDDKSKEEELIKVKTDPANMARAVDVKALMAQLAAQDSEIRDSMKKKEDYNEAIIKLEQNISSKESEIEEQNKSIKGMERNIHDLENELQLQSKHEKSKEKETQNLESEIKRLIAVRDKDMEEFENERKSLKVC